MAGSPADLSWGASSCCPLPAVILGEAGITPAVVTVGRQVPLPRPHTRVCRIEYTNTRACEGWADGWADMDARAMVDMMDPSGVV